jgi:hypothetical protein
MEDLLRRKAECDQDIRTLLRGGGNREHVVNLVVRAGAIHAELEEAVHDGEQRAAAAQARKQRLEGVVSVIEKDLVRIRAKIDRARAGEEISSEEEEESEGERIQAKLDRDRAGEEISSEEEGKQQ